MIRMNGKHFIITVSMCLTHRNEPYLHLLSLFFQSKSGYPLDSFYSFSMLRTTYEEFDTVLIFHKHVLQDTVLSEGCYHRPTYAKIHFLLYSRSTMAAIVAILCYIII
jgi:hypothetical protein